jgi:hypothetical protein
MDQEQAIPQSKNVSNLHWHCHLGATVLGGRDYSEFPLL